MPRKEFIDDMDERLKKRGYFFDRRSDAKYYKPQTQINEKGVHLLLVPQLQVAKHVHIFLGFRIRDVEHGLPIGGPIHESRRSTVDYEHLAALAE